DIAVDRHGSAAVDPRHKRTTSEAADAVAVTWTPRRSLETPRTAGSGRAGPPSNAHARNAFIVGTHPSYPACPWFGTRLSHFRAGIAVYASITPQIGKNSSTVPAMYRTGAVIDGAYPRGSKCRRNPTRRGSAIVAPLGRRRWARLGAQYASSRFPPGMIGRTARTRGSFAARYIDVRPPWLAPRTPRRFGSTYPRVSRTDAARLAAYATWYRKPLRGSGVTFTRLSGVRRGYGVLPPESGASIAI